MSEIHWNQSHGHANVGGRGPTRVYRIWGGMVNRCTNRNNRSYPRYGGRGIKVCDAWLVFENFLADMGEPDSDAHQLEREDNTAGYCKQNCRWATSKEQANNRRSSRLIEYKGRTQTASAWAEELGMKPSTILMRLNSCGWSVEKTLETPVREWGRKKTRTPAAGVP